MQKSRKYRNSSNRTLKKYKKGGGIFRFAESKVRNLQKGITNIGRDIDNRARYAATVSDEVKSRFAILAKAPQGSPEYILLRSVNIANLMKCFLTRVDAIHATWIPLSNNDDEVKRQIISIKKIFGTGSLNYFEKSSGWLITNKEFDSKNNISYSSYKDSDIIRSLNKIMGLPCTSSIDVENDAFIQYEFRASNGSSGDIPFLKILCKDQHKEDDNKVDNLAIDFQFHLGKIPFFNVKKVLVGKKTDVPVTSLINTLSRSSRVPGGVISQTAEFAIRDHLTKYVSGSDAKFNPPNDSAMISIYKSYYGNTKYEDLYGQYTPQNKFINYPFVFSNPVQRGILIAILINKKSFQDSPPDDFYMEDMVSALNASIEMK
jgi:hypothetical protein